ncbi:MAG: replication-relaxation family protein [Acidobacteriaceae bacterium]|jgi:hypothetical protein
MTPATRIRRPAAVPTFRLTKAKRESLELLAEYFCLRTNDIASLLRDRTPNENDKRSVRHTLGLLHQAGFVNRLPYLELDRETGGTTYVWGLSDKGVQSVQSFFAHAKTFDEHSQRTLDHELEISWFHMALKKFAIANNLTLYWQQSDIKRTVAPDALFAITDLAKPPGKNTLYYFLEIERAKIGHYQNGEPSIMRKLGKYHEYYGSDACQKEWGTFRQYRVIVVQPTEQRRENLLRQLHETFNHRMFWLTTESLYRHDIGAAIFRTPKDGDARSYSFLDV